MARAEWTVLIADDEPAARRGVRQLLAPFPEFAVQGECRNGSEVLAWLEQRHADVLFLDIAMPGIDGFEVIRRRTPDRMPAVVFLTAYDQHAIRAFEAEALDYLVKPVAEARFAATMRRLAKRLRGGAAREERFVVHAARGAIVVPLSEVDWIEAADNYARIWTGGRSHLIREALHTLERRVRAHGFVRAHRRALVRVAGVKQLESGSGGELVALLASGARVPVARRRRAAFTKMLRKPITA